MGWPDDNPLSIAVLGRGGPVILPCPVCTFEDKPLHMLRVTKAPAGIGGDGELYHVEDQ